MKLHPKIRKAFELLVYAYRTPSAFYDNPKAFFWNQTGHFVAIGVLSGFLGFPFIALTAYALWEGLQYQFQRATASDCLDDIAFVTCGAAFGVTLHAGFVIVGVLFLLTGTVWRMEVKAQQNAKSTQES
jgi:hypothetical protein